MTVAACPPSTPVNPGVVVFNFTEFTAIYPEFTTAGAPACQLNFSLATLNLSNCCGSPVTDPNIRQSLLYLLTAHLTLLFTPCGANNNVPPGIVGRVSSASEGSVSVSADFPSSPESAWFLQTKYGAQFWQATAAIRTMHYIAPPQQCCGVLGPFDIGFGPGWDNGGWP
jgi:hypothetical protein